MKFIIHYMNFLRQKRYKETIAYFLINRVYATPQLNIKDVINFIY